MLEKITSVIFLLSVFLIYTGYKDWKNREEQPTRITVADYVKSDKSKKWVVLTGAKINLLKAVSVTRKTGLKIADVPVGSTEVLSLYIPIESTITQNDTVSLLLETNDKEILDIVRHAPQLIAKSEAKSEAELLQFLIKGKLIRSVELSGLMERGKGGEIQKHFKNLASNFYVLKHNSAISSTGGLKTMGVGLLMLTMSILSFYLKKQAIKKAAHQAKMKKIIEAHKKRKDVKEPQLSNLKAMSEKDKLMRSLEQTPYQISQSDLEQLKFKLEQLKPKNAEHAKSSLFSSGRIGRVRYLVYSLLQLGILVIVSQTMDMDPGDPVGMIIFIILGLINLSSMRQRFHDSDKSGLLILLMWIPLLNVALVLWLLFAPGTDGPNRYGLPSR